jgi:hypothetical protein
MNNGRHRVQRNLSSFRGNYLLASENMVKKQTIGRKDDLEQLMHMCCLIFSGNLPIIKEIQAIFNQPLSA